MVVLQLPDASSVDSLASTRTNPDICKIPVYRVPNLKTEARPPQASSGSVPIGQPLPHNPDVAFTSSTIRASSTYRMRLMAPNCCVIRKILGGMQEHRGSQNVILSPN